MSGIKEITHSIASEICQVLGYFKCTLSKKELAIYIKLATDIEVENLYNKLVDKFINNAKIQSIIIVTEKKTYFPIIF